MFWLGVAVGLLLAGIYWWLTDRWYDAELDYLIARTRAETNGS